MENTLESLASDPTTPGAELQRLAGEYANLRPLIAMNPATYPALVKWLADLNDPAVNLALEQRRAAQQARSETGVGPQRVSVMTPPTAAPAPTPTWAPLATPAVATPTPTQEPQQEERRTGPIVAWVAAVILLVGAAVFLTFVLLNREPDSSSEAEREQEQVVQEEEAAEAEDPATEESEVEDLEDEQQEETPIRYPAPSSAISAPRITAPSGNINCELSEAGASCTILQYNFSDPTLSACTGSPVTLTTTDDFAEVNCTSPQIGATGGTSLSYGDYAAFANGACLSDFSGLSCWDIRTGSSFAVARDGFVTGNRGPIAPGQFWWR